MSLQLRLTLPLSGPGATWSESLGYTTINFTLPGGDLAGSTVTQRYVVVPEPSTAAALVVTAVPLLLRRRQHGRRPGTQTC